MEVEGRQRALGYLYMVLVYIIWGILPAYWKLLAAVPPLGVMAHRALWAAVLIFIVLFLSHRPNDIFSKIKSGSVLGLIVIASISLAIQWGAYLLAIVQGRLVELSLGYFIYPLVVTGLGRLFLGEKLNSSKIISLIFTGLGVLISLASMGKLPVLALTLAFSFAVYSLVKKKLGIPSLISTGFELLFLLPFALGYCLWAEASGPGFFLSTFQAGNGGSAPGGGGTLMLLLLGGGALTALTLILFASGSKRVPIFAVGLLQYISPTIVLLLGVFIYDEAFGIWRASSFGFVWLGICVYMLPGIAAMLNIRPLTVR